MQGPQQAMAAINCQDFCVRGVDGFALAGRVSVSGVTTCGLQALMPSDRCSLVRSRHLFLRPDLHFPGSRAQALSNSPLLAAGPEPRAAPAWGRAWRGPTI